MDDTGTALVLLAFGAIVAGVFVLLVAAYTVYRLIRWALR